MARRITAEEPLFTLRVMVTTEVYVSIAVWERAVSDNPTHTTLDIRVRESWADSSGKRKIRDIFKRGDLYVGIPSNQSIDGEYAKRAVLSCVAMKPGDTDADYFTSYSDTQRLFADRYGDTLSLESFERYGE